MSSFFKQLVARCVAPMVAIVLAFVFFKLRGRSFKEATPFVLWLTFLVFAMVSSPAFQAFSCEQFEGASYLRADVSPPRLDAGPSARLRLTGVPPPAANCSVVHRITRVPFASHSPHASHAPAQSTLATVAGHRPAAPALLLRR